VGCILGRTGYAYRTVEREPQGEIRERMEVGGVLYAFLVISYTVVESMVEQSIMKHRDDRRVLASLRQRGYNIIYYYQLVTLLST